MKFQVAESIQYLLLWLCLRFLVVVVEKLLPIQFDYFLVEMKRLLLLTLTAGLLSPIASSPIVDPKLHKMCLAEADYMGCVKAQLGLSNSNEIINNAGTATSRGKECHTGSTDVGNGYCKEVSCRKNSFAFRNNPFSIFFILFN